MSEEQHLLESYQESRSLEDDSYLRNLGLKQPRSSPGPASSARRPLPPPPSSRKLPQNEPDESFESAPSPHQAQRRHLDSISSPAQRSSTGGEAMSVARTGDYTASSSSMNETPLSEMEMEPTLVHEEESEAPAAEAEMQSSMDMDMTKVISQPAPSRPNASSSGDERDTEKDEIDELDELDEGNTTNGVFAREPSPLPPSSPPAITESQKENSDTSTPNPSPARASQVRVDELAVPPSSSHSVANNLLRNKRSPGGKKAFQSLAETGGESAVSKQPDSSADAEVSRSVLLSSPRREGGAGPSRLRAWGDDLLSEDGPGTSTPAFLDAPPPAPNPTQHPSLPTSIFLSRTTTSSLLARPVSPQKPPAIVTSAPMVFGTSEALKHLPARPIRRRKNTLNDFGSDEESSSREEAQSKGKQREGEKEPAQNGVGVSAQEDEVDDVGSKDTTLDADPNALTVTRPSVLPSSVSAPDPPAPLEAAPPAVPHPQISSADSSVSIPIQGARTPLFGPAFDTQIDTQSLGDFDESIVSAKKDDSSVLRQGGQGAEIGVSALMEISELQSSMDPMDMELDVEPTQIHDCFLPRSSVNGVAESSQHSKLSSTASSPERPLASANTIPATDEPSSSSLLSSPERPLASTSHGVTAPSIPSLPTGSGSAGANADPAQSTVSSNGVVPNSEGSGELPEMPGGNEAAGAEVEVPMDVDPLSSSRLVGMADQEEESETDAGPVNTPEVMKRIAATPEISPVTSEATASESSKRSKGKGKARPVIVIPTLPTRQTKPSSSTSKGKGKAVSVASEEEDEELSEPEEDGTFEETNYDDPPTPDNAKKSGRRSSGRTSGGASFVTTSIGGATTRGKRKSAEGLAPAAKKIKSVPEPSTSKKAAPSRKGRAPKAVPAIKVPTRRASSSTASSVAGEKATEEEVTPVAGPSRARFASAEQIIPTRSRRDSIAASASPPVQTKPTKSALARKSKIARELPETAPFKRVFALWPGDNFLYPGTIEETLRGGKVRILFDDNTFTESPYASVRRCELFKGDFVRYRGDEKYDTETQIEALASDVEVYRCELGETGEDTEGELEKDDIVVASRGHGGERKERLLVESVCIAPAFAAQFDNRKLTPADVAGFEGRQLLPSKPAVTVCMPDVDALPFSPAQKSSGPLKGIAFIVTIAPVTTAGPTGGEKSTTKTAAANEKTRDALRVAIEGAGGVVVDVPNLFGISTNDERTEIDFPIDAFKFVDTILLVTDRPSATPKCLVSLALTIPIVSKEFVTQSIAKGQRLDWRLFALAAGFIADLDTFVTGAQLRSMAKSTFDLASLVSAHHDGKSPFAKRTMLVISAKGDGNRATEEMHTFRQVIAAAGAARVDFAVSLAAAGDAVLYDYILYDEHDRPKALASHRGVRSRDWMKRALIMGQVAD